MALKKDGTIKVIFQPNEIDLDLLKEVVVENEFNKLKEPVTKDFVVTDAYHRVEQMQATKERIDFTLAIYTADISKFIVSKQYSFVPNTSTGALNYHTQCYDYVKSLDEYVDAVDC